MTTVNEDRILHFFLILIFLLLVVRKLVDIAEGGPHQFRRREVAGGVEEEFFAASDAVKNSLPLLSRLLVAKCVADCCPARMKEVKIPRQCGDCDLRRAKDDLQLP